MKTIAAWLAEISQRLNPTSETPNLDAQVLLARVADKPRSWILAHPEADLSRDQQEWLIESLARLQAGEPLPYILGYWEFFGLDFSVTPDVLIPRPETELLVEQAVEWLHDHPTARRAVDIGTGSGCIPVSLATNILDLHILATDISLAALQLARTNAIRHKVSERIDFLQADLFQPLKVKSFTVNDKPLDGFHPLTFNLVTANLPYIPTGTLHNLAVYRREPTIALDGGPDGLVLVRGLLAMGPVHLAPESLVLLELEARQGGEAANLAAAAFPDAHISILKDLAGLDRIIRIESG